MSEEKDPNKLDRSRTFGTVFGDPHLGFTQDGKDFDHSGRLYIRVEAQKAPEKPEEIQRDLVKLRTDKLRDAWQKKIGE